MNLCSSDLNICFWFQLVVENITCTADELGTLGSQFVSAPVDKVGYRKEPNCSVEGNSGLKK